MFDTHKLMEDRFILAHSSSAHSQLAPREVAWQKIAYDMAHRKQIEIWEEGRSGPF